MYKHNQQKLSYEQFNLLNEMQFVWLQHVYWTRMLLISIAANLGDTQDVTERLLENPYDIAEIFGEYYNAATAEKIAQLLTEHLKIGAALIVALRDKKTAEAEDLNKKWYANAAQMSEAFNAINPYYNLNELRRMFFTHIDLTSQEVALRLAGNYKADIAAFGKVEDEALSMADYFSNGIMQQFPDRFV